MAVRVQLEDFDLGAEVQALTQNDSSIGAVVTFSGLVRDTTGNLRALELEHYPAMSQAALEEIEAEAHARWPLAKSLIIHRFGRLEPGQQIMMVATCSAHRNAAFEAATFLMDYLKSRAPFWKKEHTSDGAAWVDSKIADEDQLSRW